MGPGQPIIVLHGGPDFDHNYLLPDLDRLASFYRLIYGRGRAGQGVRAQDVTLSSEMADLESVRTYLDLESAAILGHSWGGLLAMSYAIRHPSRVSHLLLMNTAPASHDDFLLLRENRLMTDAVAMAKLAEIRATPSYQEGDLEAEAAYYRLHFRTTLRQPGQLEKVVSRLRANFTKEGVLKAREIEERLYQETWQPTGFSLIPQLGRLSIPTLVIHGEYDLVPNDCAAHVAQAIPGARYVLLPECGHFSYLECPELMRQAIDAFFAAS